MNNPVNHIDPVGLSLRDMLPASCPNSNARFYSKSPFGSGPESTATYWKRQAGRSGYDFTRHCGASCEKAAIYGETFAWGMGWLNEQWENEGSRNDWHNNTTGRWCGKTIAWAPVKTLEQIRAECLECCDQQTPSADTGQIPPRAGPLCKGIREFFGLSSIR